VSDLSHKSDYQYDGLNRKVRSRDYVYSNSTWQLTADRVFVYDGWNPVCDIAVTPTVTVSKAYVWGLDLSGTRQGAGGVGGLLSVTLTLTPNPLTHFFMYDGNGNVVNLLDMSSGSIPAHYEYDPFGRLVCKEGVYADDNEYRFSTKRYCAMWSLYDYGYRHYSPDLGRWMSRDPMGEDGGWNHYVYVLNKPVSDVDNIGLSPLADPNAAAAFTHSSGTAQQDKSDDDTECRCGPNVTESLKKAFPIIWKVVMNDVDEATLRKAMSGIPHEWDLSFGSPKNANGGSIGKECKDTVTFEGHCYSQSDMAYMLYGMLHRALLEYSYRKSPNTSAAIGEERQQRDSMHGFISIWKQVGKPIENLGRIIVGEGDSNHLYGSADSLVESEDDPHTWGSLGFNLQTPTKTTPPEHYVSCPANDNKDNGTYHITIGCFKKKLRIK